MCYMDRGCPSWSPIMVAPPVVRLQPAAAGSAQLLCFSGPCFSASARGLSFVFFNPTDFVDRSTEWGLVARLNPARAASRRLGAAAGAAIRRLGAASGATGQLLLCSPGGRIRRLSGGSAREATGRDRLSALSDDLLHRILGSLDARLAVGQCSLLSRRWRHVWATMPRVTLLSLVSERFGDSLLLLREDAKLRVLSLHSSNDTNHLPHQRRWLRQVSSRGIRVLEITLGTAYHFDLPDCVFNCATLEEMIVSALTVRQAVAPKSVCLPLLKKLRLHYMQLSNPSVADKLNSGCPALEELDLSRCSLGVFRISSDTVKTLSVTACDYLEIDVSAPSVISLKLSVAGRVKLDAMPSLLSAWVNLSGDVVNPNAADTHDFLDALRNAQHLELLRI